MKTMKTIQKRFVLRSTRTGAYVERVIEDEGVFTAAVFTTNIREAERFVPSEIDTILFALPKMYEKIEYTY